MGLLSKIKALDAYPKINEDFFTKTMSGGVITIAASLVMVLLFFSELRKPLVAWIRLRTLSRSQNSAN